MAVPRAVFSPSAEFEDALEAEPLKLHTIVTVILGTYNGPQLTLASTDTDEFCASSDEEDIEPNAPGLMWAAMP